MGNYPFPQPYPTLRTCTACGRTFRLVDFRRWFGGKRVLFTTCNACQPEATLSADDPRALQNAVARGRIPPEIAEAKLAAREARTSAKRSNAQFLRRVSERKRIWNERLFTPLRRELTWVKSVISICRMGQQPSLFTGVRPEPTVAASYAGWQEFFEAYERVLRDAEHRARVKLGLGRTGRIEPSDEEMRISTYVFPQTLGALRRLLSACKPIPGRRAFRQPWMLRWRTEGEHHEAE